jgi:uncharacterized protein YggE
MKKIWFALVGVALVLMVAGLAGCGSQGTPLSGNNLEIRGSLNSQQEGIWVSGEGKVTAVPDVAILSLGIQAQEASVAEAQAKAAEAMARVMAALTGGGVAQKDIQTQNFSIQKVTRWDNDKQQEVVLGYQVTNTVTAKIRVLPVESYSLDYKAGAVIDAVAAAGGDLTVINSIGFTVDDPTAYYAEARQKAVADAAAKAKQMADLTGVKLGKPTYISESSYVPGPIYRDVMAKAEGAPATSTPVSLGEMEITTNVQIAYAID